MPVGDPVQTEAVNGKLFGLTRAVLVWGGEGINQPHLTFFAYT